MRLVFVPAFIIILFEDKIHDTATFPPHYCILWSNALQLKMVQRGRAFRKH